MLKPSPDSYPAYYLPYINLVTEDNVIDSLESQLQITRAFFTEIPIEKESFKYAEGKWSIKEVFGHMIDTERIMA